MRPSLLEVLRSAEQNLRKYGTRKAIDFAETLDDVSNREYFEALMHSTALQDPVMQRQPEAPQLGMDWRCRLHRQRLEEVLPLLSTAAEVRGYSKSDIRALCKSASIPLRFQLSLKKSVRFAAIFDDLVSSERGPSFHAIVSQYIQLEGQRTQPVLRAWLKHTFTGIQDGSVDHFMDLMGLRRGVRPPSIALLQTVGVVGGCSANDFSTDEAREATIRACQSLALETGHTFAYIDHVFCSNFTWSRVTDKRFAFPNTSVCTFDDPMCDTCAHAPYCERRGVRDVRAEPKTIWLTEYAPQWSLDEEAVLPLKYLPGLALDAVHREIADGNSLWWRANNLHIDDADAGGVRAVMFSMQTSDVREAVGERSYGRTETANAQKSATHVRDNVPILIAPAGDGLYGVRSDGLLIAYEEAGVQEVQVLAVDWGQVGALLKLRKQ
jgi:hypothetical protein